MFQGDLSYHLVEDVGICLGQALLKALGEKVGITRYGSASIPMDETLGFCAVDLSDRAYFVIDLALQDKRIEDMASEDIIHFWESLALNSQINLHLKI
jgi:imidazoleglycerol-phosphate dehydratase